jgi:hypothetical protein
MGGRNGTVHSIGLPLTVGERQDGLNAARQSGLLLRQYAAPAEGTNFVRRDGPARPLVQQRPQRLQLRPNLARIPYAAQSDAQGAPLAALVLPRPLSDSETPGAKNATRSSCTGAERFVCWLLVSINPHADDLFCHRSRQIEADTDDGHSAHAFLAQGLSCLQPPECQRPHHVPTSVPPPSHP